uniref:Uncharacterized protein LOC102807125 n=1 Tax=Saccoglossus kowalevskii TaxID=10224 RepID=A0ABM0LY44_SACKO
SIKGQTAEDDIGQTRGYFNSWQKDHQDYNASSSHVFYSPIQKPSHNSFQTHTPSHAFVEHAKETASIQGQTAADDIGQNGAYISDLQQDRQDCIGFSSRALHTPGHEPCDYIDEKGKQTTLINSYNNATDKNGAYFSSRKHGQQDNKLNMSTLRRHFLRQKQESNIYDAMNSSFTGLNIETSKKCAFSNTEASHNIFQTHTPSHAFVEHGKETASIQGQTAADDIGQNGAYISDLQQDRQDCIGFSSRALHTPGHEPCDYIDEKGKQTNKNGAYFNSRKHGQQDNKLNMSTLSRHFLRQKQESNIYDAINSSFTGLNIETTSIKGQTAEDDIGQTRGYFNSWQKDHQDYNASSSHVLNSPIQKPSHNSFQTHTPSHAFVEHGKETASIQGQTAADDIGQNGAYISDLQQDRQDCIGFSSRALHTPGHEPCDYIDGKGKQTSKIRLFFLNT